MKFTLVVLELDARLMDNAFRLVDEQLAFLNETIAEDLRTSGDSPFMSNAEYLHGFGFVAAQRYLSSTCGTFKVGKQRAFAIGQQTNGISIPSVVNAAANFWKHADEWDFNKLTEQNQKTLATIKTVGVEVEGPCGWTTANIFHKLRLKKFSDLSPLLRQWSDAVDQELTGQASSSYVPSP